MNFSMHTTMIIKLTAVATSVLCLSLNGCGNSTTAPSTTPTAVETPVATTQEAPNAQDLSSVAARYLRGIENRNVLEDARNIDLLAKAERIEKIITKIDVDDSDVDTTKPGTYKVKYTVTVDVKSLKKAEAYIAEHPAILESDAAAATPTQDLAAEQEQVEGTVQSDTSTGDAQIETPVDGSGVGQTSESSENPVLPNIPDEVFEDPASSESGDPSKTEVIVIEKDVTVVTPEEAIEIINGGGEVWTDGSTPVTAEDITGGDAPHATTTKPAAVTEPADDRDKEQEQTGSSQYDSGDDGQESSGSENQSSGDSHVHNWVERTETVTHEETGHYETVKVGTKTVVDEDAWQEKIYEDILICNSCGYEASTTSEMSEHVADVHDFEASWGVVSEVVDTIDHPAVTHEEDVYEEIYVKDSDEWTEERVVGYYCTICGAEK